MVVTEEATESLVATDRSVSVDVAPVRFNELIAETLVTTLRMIMIDERPDGSSQGRFGEEDHAIEALAFYRKHETLAAGASGLASRGPLCASEPGVVGGVGRTENGECRQ